MWIIGIEKFSPILEGEAVVPNIRKTMPWISVEGTTKDTLDTDGSVWLKFTPVANCIFEPTKFLYIPLMLIFDPAVA